MPCCGIYAFDVCTRRALGDTEASKAVIQISVVHLRLRSLVERTLPEARRQGVPEGSVQVEVHEVQCYDKRGSIQVHSQSHNHYRRKAHHVEQIRNVKGKNVGVR